jgi:DNA (cytosine-5)-methyltransferase 1
LYCGAGGCAAGYVRAGFEVHGVDAARQPNFLASGASAFIQADALEYLRQHWREYDIIHASPPCQRYSRCRFTPPCRGKDYPDLLPATLQALAQIARPWVVENVEDARRYMPGAIRLCGTMFHLPLQRHRLFLSSHPLSTPGPCRHRKGMLGIYSGRINRLGVGGTPYVASSGRTHYRPRTAPFAEGCAAMGIDWMRRDELCEAIPPAYTHHLGLQLLPIVQARPQAAQ